MKESTYKGSRLILYFFLVSIFLFISGNIGRYLIETQGVNRETGLFLQGIMFTGLTLVVLYWLKAKNPDLFKDIDLKMPIPVLNGLSGQHCHCFCFYQGLSPLLCLEALKTSASI